MIASQLAETDAFARCSAGHARGGCVLVEGEVQPAEEVDRRWRPQLAIGVAPVDLSLHPHMRRSLALQVSSPTIAVDRRVLAPRCVVYPRCRLY